MSDETPPSLPGAVLQQAIDHATAETQAFIQHFAMCFVQLRDALQEGAATLTAAERATAFAVGCQHLAEPIRRDIERLQRDEPEPEPEPEPDCTPEGQRWAERIEGPAAPRGHE